jgi:hypothetical protein
MLKFVLLFILSFLLALEAFTQSQIRGKVQESDGKPLPFANVLLVNAKDSTLVKGMVSSEAGLYSLDRVGVGEYRIAATMVGYKQIYSPPFTINQERKTIQLDALILPEEARQLNEVTIEASKPLFEQHLDRLVVNVQSSITAAGATALEVLERSPGITVNRQNNTVAMSGKEGVVVMINGKQSRVPMSTVVQMLGSMNAGNIEKIELITTPSSNYDAEGNAGVINIVMKKNMEYGTNGSYALTMGYGWYERPAASVNFNHRTQKLNLFGDYSFALNHIWNKFAFQREINYQDVVTQTNNVVLRQPRRYNHTARLGFDYNLSSQTTLSGLVSGFSDKFKVTENNTTHIIRSQEIIKNIKVRHNEINHWQHLMGNLNLQHKFPGNQQISLDADYLYYYDDNPHQYTNNHLMLSEGEAWQDQLTMTKKTPIHLWVSKADYTKNISEQTKLEAGVKATISRLHNNVELKSLESGIWQVDTAFTQHIQMLEDIGAAYVNFSHQINAKTKLQTGLRWEYTHTDMDTREGKPILERKYHNLFPSLFISRDLSKKNSVQFSYGRRITRPTYNDLAPFVFFIDPSTFLSGNLALRPAITDALQATYRFKGSYLLTMGYSHDKHTIIQWQIHVDPKTNKQYARSENLKNSDTYSLNFTFPLKLTSWWQMQNNMMGIWQINRSVYEGVPVQMSAGYARANITQSFTLPAGFSAEISGFYQSRSPFGIAYMKAFGTLNIGLQKKLLNDKGNFRLTVDDLFWTNRLTIISDYPELNLKSDIVGLFSEPRVVRLTYSRNFGNKNVKATQHRSTGSEEERKRVN